MKNSKTHNDTKTGFKTPKNYFNNFEETMLNNIQAQTSGFKTPDNYFNTLNESLSKTIFKKNTPKIISLFSRENLLYASSVAAVILLLFNLSFFNKTPDWNTIDNNTIERYILEEDINSFTLISSLTDDDIIENNTITYSINDNNIETYLLDDIEVEYLFID